MTATYPPSVPIWCAGCGHYGVQAALLGAFDQLAIQPHEVLVIAGIGCSGTVQNNLGTYGYHALHGRVLPTATGVHLANPALNVIATGGDGDGYAIGMGHLVHAFRRNPSLTYIVMNNGTYGLTKGQPSPTGADPAFPGTPLDAVNLGLSLPSSTFIARGFTGRADQLRRLTVEALSHARAGLGFAFLEVLSPCVTYNDTYAEWQASLHDVDADSSFDHTDRTASITTALEAAAEGRIAVGLLFQRRGGPREPVRSPISAIVDPTEHRRAYGDLVREYAL